MTSLEGREGCNLRGVTVINSPFNNSCPTWPASPSQCPLCIYAYVYLCIHSMQEITTAGVQSFFFLWKMGDCIGLTLEMGGKLAHLKRSKYSFTLRLICWYVCAEIYIYSHLRSLILKYKERTDYTLMSHFGITRQR